jgi:hypothetical protein
MDNTKTEKHNLYHNHDRRCRISISNCGRTQEENIQADDVKTEKDKKIIISDFEI